MIEQTSQFKEKKTRFKDSISIKMLVVGFLILVLLIPLSFIKDLIQERETRQKEVIHKINKSWGNETQLYGPILKIPYGVYKTTSYTDNQTGRIRRVRKKEETKYLYIFPDNLQVEGDINAEIKKRGIYQTTVYKTNILISGSFNVSDSTFLEILPKDIEWNKTIVIAKTTNLKGINDSLVIHINENSYAFESVFKNNNSNNYLNQYIPISYTIKTKPIDLRNKIFNFSIEYNASGSKRFQIIPIGKETKMHLTSNWTDASFQGEYLPYNSDKKTKNGFNAQWKILEMNRPFSQIFDYLPNLDQYAFGVNFIIPIDNYQQTERSAKYGYLMIALTFLLFLLIQLISKINIHPFQYLMIGLALVIFYTLLISISEHLNFTKAYLIAGSAVVILITFYSKSILKNWKFPLFIGLSLSALYVFIFVIIQMENYALLVGSIGLFGILAAVMYTSRKIEWNS